jgi:Bacterial Ig-like domain (group 2)
VCTPAGVSVTPGSKAQLRANVTFSDTTVVDETTSVVWSSPTPATATFQGGDSLLGLISGVATGTVTISPTFGGATATGPNSCVITVP